MTYNTRSPAVKRLMKEAGELSKPTELYYAQPSEENLFEWHFTIRGPCDTEFDGGVYHGRIILPPDYPMKPPNIVFLTENGRFEQNRRICLSISSYHPESWRPSWSIRTALLAIIGFMTTPGMGAIGSLDYPKEERKRLAKESTAFQCETCGAIKDLVLPLTEASKTEIEEAKERASEMTLTAKPDQSDIAGEVIPPEPERKPAAATSETPLFPTISNVGPAMPIPVACGSNNSMMPNPPFWLCFPYYPTGFPGMNPMMFAPFPSAPQPAPMSFDEFMKQRKQQPTQPNASGSSAPSTSAGPSTSPKEEVKPPETVKVEPVVTASPPTAPPSASADEERARQAANSVFESAFMRHRQRAERMRLAGENQPTNQNIHRVRQNAAAAQQNSGLQFMFAICLVILAFLVLRRFLWLAVNVEWMEDLEPEF